VSLAEQVVGDIFAGVFRAPAEECIADWASRNVYLDEKMAARPGFYNPEVTPWCREFMEIPRQLGTWKAVAMKDNQSGFTEAALNVLRWMPENMPGNALYCINSREKAKRVSKVRLRKTLTVAAAGQLTENPDDFSTYSINLTNMEITVSGSGSIGAFVEAWYRLAILDECELHEEEDGTTTIEKAESRFKTVADATLLAMSKPEVEGGVIHREFVAGTQEEWEVPCPRCGEYQRIEFEWLRFNHCKDLAEGWDLARVEEETWLECRHCGGRIEERDKAAMNAAGRWKAREKGERMKLPDGRPVPPDPGVRSFHISALYSMFPNATWGKIAKKWLLAFVVEPNERAQRDVQNNDFGLPWKETRAEITSEAIQNLRGGIVEERDGRRVVLGQEFGLVYEPHGVGRSELVGELPFRPLVMSVTVDQQEHTYVYLVFAWDRRWNSWLVDYGDLPDAEAVIDLRARPYPVRGEREPALLYGGLADCGDRKNEVVRMCLKAQSVGFDLHPSRGHGFLPDSRGTNIRIRPDYLDGQNYLIYDFWNHGLESDFYLGKIGRRSEPRLWLPTPIPERIVKEWTSTKLVAVTVGGRRVQKWIHDGRKYGPNDLGDCAKQQLLVPQLLMPVLGPGDGPGAEKPENG